MKRVILLCSILCSTLILSGCSYSYNFFVVNDSGDVLEIEFKWNNDLYSVPYKFKFEKINTVTVEKLEAINSFTKEEIEAAERTNTFRVSLEPKQALRIHSISNRENKKFDVEVDETFRINSLNLKGKKGSVELTGDQIWFQFRKSAEGYFIVYK